jgi:hypothetical protein
MRPNKSRWLLVAVLASVAAVGVPYWRIPYANANLPDSLLTPALLVVAGSALLLCAGRVAGFWRATCAVGASVAIAVVIRVLVGVAQDPTSHNLWPIEVVIALAVGFLCAAAGAIGGSLVGAFVGGPRQEP